MVCVGRSQPLVLHSLALLALISHSPADRPVEGASGSKVLSVEQDVNELEEQEPKLNVRPRTFFTRDYKCNNVLMSESMGRNDAIDKSTRCHAHPCFPRCDLTSCSEKTSNDQLFKTCKHCFQSCFRKDRHCHFGKTFMLEEDEDTRYMQCLPLGQTYSPLGFSTFALRPESWFRYGWKVFYEAGSASEALKLGVVANIDARMMGFSSGVKIPFIRNLGGFESTLDTSELQVKIHIELPDFDHFKKAFEEGFPDDIPIFIEVLQDQDQDGVLDDLLRTPDNSETTATPTTRLETTPAPTFTSNGTVLLATNAHARMKSKSLVSTKLDMKRHQDGRTSTGEHCFFDKIMEQLDDHEAVNTILKYVKGFDICAFAEKTPSSKANKDNLNGGNDQIVDTSITFGVQLKKPHLEVGGLTVVSENSFKIPLGGKFPILTLNTGDVAGIDCPTVLKEQLGGRLCPRGLQETAGEIAEALKLSAKDVDEASRKEANLQERVSVAEDAEEAEEDQNDEDIQGTLNEGNRMKTDSNSKKKPRPPMAFSESTAHSDKIQIEDKLLRQFMLGQHELLQLKKRAKKHAKMYGHAGHHTVDEDVRISADTIADAIKKKVWTSEALHRDR